MIAGYTYVLILTQKLNALVRVRPIAHHITKTPYLFKTPSDIYIPKPCLKSSEITVNIAKDCIPHPANYTIRKAIC
jgi:hypothetical protein